MKVKKAQRRFTHLTSNVIYSLLFVSTDYLAPGFKGLYSQNIHNRSTE